MHREIILSIATIFVSSIFYACTCVYSEEFNLKDYDSYKYIFEVKIKSKYEFKKDTVKTDKHKPPSPFEFGLLTGYKISMIEVFKGNPDFSEKIIGFFNGSSCSWIPEVGITYIFYTNSLYDIGACNRKMIKKYDKENYLNEKLILQSLKTKPKEVKIKSNEKTLIEGSYINDKREGIWKIYSTNDQNTLAFKLNYINGELTSIKKENGYLKDDEWQNTSYSYYLKQVKIKTN